MYASRSRFTIALTACLWLWLGAGSAGARQHSLPGATVTANAPIGAALDTQAPAAGGGQEIEIGGNCLANQKGCSTRHFPYGNHPVQLVVLNRSDLSTVTSQTLTPDTNGANAAQAAAKQYGGGSYLMVLASLPGTATSAAYSQAIKLITGSPHAGSFDQGGGWAAAGVPDASPTSGQVTGVLNPGFLAEGGHPYGDLTGYFQRFQLTSTDSQYSFVSGRYESYDTRADGSGATVDVMRVGDTRYTLRLPDANQCTGGYAIVVLAAGNLVPLSQGAYATNCPGSGQDIAGWQALNSALAKAASISGALVFLQSIGNPANPGCQCGSAFGYASGGSIETLGATADTWNRSLAAGGYLNQSGHSGYAMVGSPTIAADALAGSRPESYAPEVASVITGQSARLQGLLRADYDWNYLPVSGAGAQTRLGPTVATAEYGPSQAWPTGGTPGQLQVLAYISAGAKGSRKPFTALRYSRGSSCYRPSVPDVRFEFCDTARTYASVKAAIGLKHPPAACRCTQEDWNAVTRDLSEEISLRDKVVAYLGELAQVYGNGTACTNALSNLRQISSQLREQFVVSVKALVTGGRWVSLMSDLINVASSILYTAFPDGSTLANVLNNISSAGYLATDGIGFGAAGAGTQDKSLGAQIKVTAAQLGPVLQKTYCTTQYGFGRAEAIILSDYGKLHLAGSSSTFQISQSTLDAIVPQLNIGAERFIYAHLLGALYRPYALLESNLNTPNFHNQIRTPVTYACNNFIRRAIYPWKQASRGSWLMLSRHDPAFPGANAQGIGMVFATPFHYNAFGATHVLTPSASVMKTITSPIATGGLGEDRLDLFLHHFDRLALQCTNGAHVSGPQKKYGPSNVAWP